MAVTEEKKAKVTKAKAAPKKVAKKAAPKKQEIVAAANADVAFKVLVEPWITEKTHKAIAENKYTFKVVANATKKQVKKAIEGFYNVKVEKLNCVTVLPKKRAYGRHMGKISGFKKATVTLKEGDKIEFFQGA